MKTRILSIDILRGLGIMVIIVIHRLHYHWQGMRSKEVLHEHFSGPWMPLLVAVIALFTMAGIFYFISGIVNTYSFYNRIENKNMSIKKVVLGGVVAGAWIFILNFLHRLFFSNGFLLEPDGTEPEYPVGFIVGWIRNSNDVQFYWSQFTEPGTLAVIGLVVILVSLLLGILLQPKIRKKQSSLFRILIVIGFISLLVAPVVKYNLRPAYDEAYHSGLYLKAFIFGLISQEFSLSPYLGYGLIGAVMGLSLAMNERYKSFRKRNRYLTTILFILGITAVILFDREDPFGEWVIGTGITYIELAIFILILSFLLKRIDFIKENSEKKSSKRFSIIRSFGMVALTVYFLEPTLAELLKTTIVLLTGNSGWTNQIFWVLLFGFLCLGIWTIILHYWKKINYAGSFEWLSVKIVYLLAKKRSGKTEFDSIK